MEQRSGDLLAHSRLGRVAEPVQQLFVDVEFRLGLTQLHAEREALVHKRRGHQLSHGRLAGPTEPSEQLLVDHECLLVTAKVVETPALAQQCAGDQLAHA